MCPLSTRRASLQHHVTPLTLDAVRLPLNRKKGPLWRQTCLCPLLCSCQHLRSTPSLPSSSPESLRLPSFLQFVALTGRATSFMAVTSGTSLCRWEAHTAGAKLKLSGAIAGLNFVPRMHLHVTAVDLVFYPPTYPNANVTSSGCVAVQLHSPVQYSTAVRTYAFHMLPLLLHVPIPVIQ